MCSTLRILKTFVENISGIYSSDMFKVQSKPEFLRLTNSDDNSMHYK